MLQKGLIPILFNDGLTPEYKAYKARVAADSGTLTIVSDKNFSDQIKSLKQTGVYDSASLICIPSGSKAGKLYSLKPTDGSGDFTVARNSVKQVLGKDGYYREVAVNVPAIEWSHTLQKFGVSIEPQRTNLLLNSETLSTQIVAVTAQAYTLAFNGTGTIELSGASTGTLVGTGINNRVSLTFTPTAGTLTLTVTGECKFAQLEAGTTATSPIVTSGATVTRLADVVSITDATSLFGSKVGTIITEFIVNALPADNTARGIVFFRHPTENRYIGYYTYNSLLHAEVFGGASVFLSNTSIATGRHIAALAFANNDIAFYLDGVQIATSSTATIADGIQLLLISQGTAYSTARLAGKIVKIVIDKTRLSNAKLQEITTL